MKDTSHVFFLWKWYSNVVMKGVKALNFENHAFPGQYKTALAKMKHVVATYGETFDIEYGGKKIPIIVKPRFVTPSLYHFRVNINYPFVAETMDYYTLSIHLGNPEGDHANQRERPYHAYIEYINANIEHGLQGSFLVKFAIAFMQFLGVHKVALYDAANIKLVSDNKTGKTCIVPLSFMLFMKDRVTFYGRFGFRPVQSPNDTSFRDSKERLDTMCKLGKKLQQVQVGKLSDYVTNLSKALATLKLSNTSKTSVVAIEKQLIREYGLTERTKVNIPVTKEFVEGVKTMKLYLEGFDRKTTLKELFSALTCKMYKVIEIFVSELMVADIYINDVVITSDVGDLYKQVADLAKGHYELDLTSTGRDKPFCSP